MSANLLPGPVAEPDLAKDPSGGLDARCPAKAFSKEAIKALMEYDWPGNVRELKNVVLRYITVKQVDLPGSTSLVRNASAVDPSERKPDPPKDLRLRVLVDDAERVALVEALEKIIH